MNILSLFDGVGGARIALDKSKISFNNYFSSEIDRFALKVLNDNYDDRFIIVPNVDTTLPMVCYGSCESCDQQNMVDVTFSVDMSDIETNPAGAHISGEAFPEPGLTMSDPDGDDVWTITVQEPVGELIRYKFANGPVPNWQGDWEEFIKLA